VHRRAIRECDDCLLLALPALGSRKSASSGIDSGRLEMLPVNGWALAFGTFQQKKRTLGAGLMALIKLAMACAIT
jgi:hypothetical protein